MKYIIIQDRPQSQGYEKCFQFTDPSIGNFVHLCKKKIKFSEHPEIINA